MTGTREQSFSVGKYLVPPLARLKTPATSLRPYRSAAGCTTAFHASPPREAARRYAIEQGINWLRPPPVPAPL
jgi:hypothetical protein